MTEKKVTVGRFGRRRVLQAIAGAGLLAGGGLIGAATAAPGEQQWQFETEDDEVVRSAVDDGTVYAGTAKSRENYDATLYAVDASTGEQKWQFKTGYRTFYTPTVVSGTVYIGSGNRLGDTNLYAVNADTGEQQWQFENVLNPGSFARGAPPVSDGTVFISGADRVLIAVDTATGEKKWEEEAGFNSQGVPPKVVDDTVYGGWFGNYLAAFDAATGEKQWQFPVENFLSKSADYITSLMATNSTVYTTSVRQYDNVISNGTLFAFDAATGEQQWQSEIGDALAFPMVADSTVYVGGVFDEDDGRSLYVVAVDAATGEQRWQFTPRLRTSGFLGFARPTIVDGTIYVGSLAGQGGILYAVDAATGEQQWQFRTGARRINSPAVADGTVYVGDDNGTLYAIEAGAAGETTTGGGENGMGGADDEGETNGGDGDDESAGAGSDQDESTGSGSDATPEGSGGDGSGDDGFGPGFGIGGALASLGGAGYLLKRRLENDENSEK